MMTSFLLMARPFWEKDRRALLGLRQLKAPANVGVGTVIERPLTRQPASLLQRVQRWVDRGERPLFVTPSSRTLTSPSEKYTLSVPQPKGNPHEVGYLKIHHSRLESINTVQQIPGEGFAKVPANQRYRNAGLVGLQTAFEHSLRHGHGGYISTWADVPAATWYARHGYHVLPESFPQNPQKLQNSLVHAKAQQDHLLALASQGKQLEAGSFSPTMQLREGMTSETLNAIRDGRMTPDQALANADYGTKAYYLNQVRRGNTVFAATRDIPVGELD